eukprot:4323628-Amphidinium_carterae.1
MLWEHLRGVHGSGSCGSEQSFWSYGQATLGTQKDPEPPFVLWGRRRITGSLLLLGSSCNVHVHEFNFTAGTENHRENTSDHQYHSKRKKNNKLQELRYTPKY